jgi:hypothetical protein
MELSHFDDTDVAQLDGLQAVALADDAAAAQAQEGSGRIDAGLGGGCRTTALGVGREVPVQPSAEFDGVYGYGLGQRQPLLGLVDSS